MRPKACRADLSLSRPKDISSEEEEKADRDDSALRTLSSLRGLRGHPRCPHYAERRSLSDSKCWNGKQKYYLCARSSNVPPHLRPKACRADFSLSRPKDISSALEEKADRSRCAPVMERAPVASLGQPGNLHIVILHVFKKPASLERL